MALHRVIWPCTGPALASARVVQKPKAARKWKGRLLLQDTRGIWWTEARCTREDQISIPVTGSSFTVSVFLTSTFALLKTISGKRFLDWLLCLFSRFNVSQFWWCLFVKCYINANSKSWCFVFLLNIFYYYFAVSGINNSFASVFMSLLFMFNKMIVSRKKYQLCLGVFLSWYSLQFSPTPMIHMVSGSWHIL